MASAHIASERQRYAAARLYAAAITLDTCRWYWCRWARDSVRIKIRCLIRLRCLLRRERSRWAARDILLRWYCRWLRRDCFVRGRAWCFDAADDIQRMRDISMLSLYVYATDWFSRRCRYFLFYFSIWWCRHVATYAFFFSPPPARYAIWYMIPFITL